MRGVTPQPKSRALQSSLRLWFQVALLAEEYGGLGKEIGRQFLRTHRAFTATVLTADGAEPAPYQR